MTDVEVMQLVMDHYGAVARRVSEGTGCCGPASEGDVLSQDLYDALEQAELPAEALEASLGCGNPTALAELHEGEVVLDLGSGGGIDVLLSARRVGPTGKAYGLDMTEDMLALAEENRRRSGLTNVEFLRGEIEAVPLPDSSVDVVISNCVINLSVDKDRVFAEAHRVLRPGGRFAVSDTVLRRGAPDALRKVTQLWAGCIAGALEEDDYRTRLAAAGFARVEIQPTSSFTEEAVRPFLDGNGLAVDTLAPLIIDNVMSAFVRAVKS